MMHKEIYEIGQVPPIGVVPKQMYAQVIRADRFGDPNHAFKVEKIAVPEIKPDEVLVYVMAAGVNYNNVWAALGRPGRCHCGAARKSEEEEPRASTSAAAMHPASSGRSAKASTAFASAITWWRIAGCGIPSDPWITGGGDPIIAPSARIWGYETNWGSFAQYTLVQAHQLLPKAPELSWAAAAACTLVGATAYRMLCSWHPHTVRRE